MKDFEKEREQSRRFSVSSGRVFANASTPVDDEQGDEFDPIMHGRNGGGGRSKTLIIIALLIAIVAIIVLFMLKNKQKDATSVTPPAEVVDSTDTAAVEDSVVAISIGTIDELNKQSKTQIVQPPAVKQGTQTSNQPMEVQFTPEEKTSIDAVKAAVTAKRGQVESLYRKATAVNQSTGVVKIMLDLASSGRVQNYTIEKVSGDLSDAFMRDLDNVVKNWTFNIKTPIQYAFQYRLSN